MADKEQPKQPTHRAYSVIRREGQDDFWLNLGLVFPHKDDGGINIMLQGFSARRENRLPRDHGGRGRRRNRTAPTRSAGTTEQR